MKRNIIATDNLISQELQKTLNQIAAQAADRKDELMDLLGNEQPGKSHLVETDYGQCIWWEGCYYCQDDNKQWHRVKCFR
ncbi:hypothetical protein H6G89_06055 [Oscillatoria sp. FACHB-1407]|uniref:hypothetical protein n=1 Tax=Oscillatoria sp. FACHB-1407 TaxID=2692847 RepID=UPI0016866991|nr:hypothetical protein [Oscillatoria sp. FACHB-1407]MBD2460603.1 hypothetical protein [Oscillatoria sp. FACHB-1407]